MTWIETYLVDGPGAGPPSGMGGLADIDFLTLLQAIEKTGPSRNRDATIAAYKAWIGLHAGEIALLPMAWMNLGVELGLNGDRASAQICYRNALVLRPDFHHAAINLGLMQEADGEVVAALATWNAALQSDEARTALLNQRGRLLEQTGQLDAAERILFASLCTIPLQPDVIQHWVHLRQRLCLWPIFGDGVPGLTQDEIACHVGPLAALALFDDVTAQRRVAGTWIARKLSKAPERLAPAAGYRHPRLRLGYMSSDFCSHAMSYLIAEMLERHDRSGFEVFGYCSSRDDGSDIRTRVIAAFDHHCPIGAMSDEDAARRIADDEIDILIDLNGLTLGARLAILRWRPAPVQMTYLGYIGPVPLDELDYIICDHQVIPPDQCAAYAPKPLALPGVFQANDAARSRPTIISRPEAGLPAAGFVFCCFSNTYKMTAELVEAWMRILNGVPGSVLWLPRDNATAAANICAMAARCGVAPGRIIFSDRVAPDIYLARLGAADLFLDTAPYNAGTIASDALRMGLPVLTLRGRSFAGRMAASLLSAMDADDCIAEDRDAYIATAIRLGTDAVAHAALRAKIGEDAWARSLGNTSLFLRGFEQTLLSVAVRAGGGARAA